MSTSIAYILLLRCLTPLQLTSSCFSGIGSYWTRERDCALLENHFRKRDYAWEGVERGGGDGELRIRSSTVISKRKITRFLSVAMKCTRHEQLWIRLSPELAGFFIICWVFGFIWKVCLSSLIWYMATCSPIRSDWVTDQNVASLWPSQAQLRRSKQYTKFNVVLSILNHLHL